MSFDLEQLANGATSTLNGGISSGAATLVVNSATPFPTAGNFRIIIGSEIMKVTAVSGTTFTVSRADGGSSAASHSNGDAVTLILTKESVKQLLVDALGRPLFTYPRLTDFSWQNQGTATADDNDRGVYLNAPASGADQIRILEQSAPGTPYRLTTYLIPQLTPVNFLLAGIGFRESGTGKLMTFPLSCNTGPDAWLSVERWNSPTSFNFSMTHTASFYKAWSVTPWLRLRDDGTTIYFDYSFDGYKFTNYWSEARGAFFTIAPDRLFLFTNANHASASASVRLLSWAKT